MERTNDKIVIVDDNAAHLRLLSVALNKVGYKVHLATDGESALKMIREISPSLILLDITLPGMSGYQVCERLKSDVSISHIPVVFISASCNESNIVHAFESGGADFIAKPYKRKELLARVSAHINRYKEVIKLTKNNQMLQRNLDAQTPNCSSTDMEESIANNENRLKFGFAFRSIV